MTRKRKRKHDAGSDLSNAKRPKLQQNIKNETHITKHPVLDCYYPRVQTLRQFILTTIPNISKRRKRLLKRTEPVPADAVAQADLNLEDAYRLLDNVLVGADVVKLPQSDKGGDFQQFTQQLSASTARSLFGQATASYAEVIFPCNIFHRDCHKTRFYAVPDGGLLSKNAPSFDGFLTCDLDRRLRFMAIILQNSCYCAKTSPCALPWLFSCLDPLPERDCLR